MRLLQVDVALPDSDEEGSKSKENIENGEDDRDAFFEEDENIGRDSEQNDAAPRQDLEESGDQERMIGSGQCEDSNDSQPEKRNPEQGEDQVDNRHHETEEREPGRGGLARRSCHTRAFSSRVESSGGSLRLSAAL